MPPLFNIQAFFITIYFGNPKNVKCILLLTENVQLVRFLNTFQLTQNKSSWGF